MKGISVLRFTDLANSWWSINLYDAPEDAPCFCVDFFPTLLTSNIK